MAPRSWDPSFVLRSLSQGQNLAEMVGPEAVADLEVEGQADEMGPEMVSGLADAILSDRAGDQEDIDQVVEAAGMVSDHVPALEVAAAGTSVAHVRVSGVAAETRSARDQVLMDLQVVVDAVLVAHATQDGQVALAGVDASDQDHQPAEAAFKCTT